MLRYRIAQPALSLSRWCRRVIPASAGFRTLIFHDVSEVDRGAFENLIQYLDERKAIISPKQAAQWLSGIVPKGIDPIGMPPPCLISFDDGFVGNYELAMDVLSQRGIQALYFICPGLVDLPSSAQFGAICDNVITNPSTQMLDAARCRLMDWQQIRDLSSAGHTIGAHGMTHLSLAGLTGDALRHEVTASGDNIEDRISKPVEWYAFAFGDIDNISPSALEVIKQRYAYCRAGVRGLNSISTHPHTIHGDPVDLSAPVAYQHLTIDGTLDPLYARRRLHLRSMLPNDG